MENYFDHIYDASDRDHVANHYKTMRAVLEVGPETDNYSHYWEAAQNHWRRMVGFAITHPASLGDAGYILGKVSEYKRQQIVGAVHMAFRPK